MGIAEELGTLDATAQADLVRSGQVTATELAGWCGTIPWEVLTAITYRVPRLYRGGQAS